MRLTYHDHDFTDSFDIPTVSLESKPNPRILAFQPIRAKCRYCDAIRVPVYNAKGIFVEFDFFENEECEREVTKL